MADVTRRYGFRRRTVVAVVGGSLAILPVVTVSGAAAWWLDPLVQERTTALPLVGGYPPVLNRVSVDGSLPESPNPDDIRVYELPEPGPLGIPDTALAAYKRAAERVGGEYPGCHLDWALIASIGRIESGHARGGYVDSEGNTLEPILGPVLDGTGPFAAITDTDGGEHDGDPTWDRAVGPMQFIPSTWARHGADGNDDGVRDPNNIYDATTAAGRYLCAGGLDLSDPEQLRTAVYRYNNSTSYVDTVLRWAEAYRSGVLSVPDSEVPRAVPEALRVDASGDDHASGAQLPSAGSPPPADGQGEDSPGSTPPGSTPPESTPPENEPSPTDPTDAPDESDGTNDPDGPEQPGGSDGPDAPDESDAPDDSDSPDESDAPDESDGTNEPDDPDESNESDAPDDSDGSADPDPSETNEPNESGDPNEADEPSETDAPSPSASNSPNSTPSSSTTPNGTESSSGSARPSGSTQPGEPGATEQSETAGEQG